MNDDPTDATSKLRDDILSGLFPPGDRLLEVALAERYQCGRAAVREALVELVAEGLVQREANRGATVRRVSIAEAIQITEARASLEALIAANAARHATDDERDELAAVIADMRIAVDTNDHPAYSALNGQFHRRLREISRHEVASSLVANLRNRAASQQYRLAVVPGRPAQSLEQHGAIADAVIAGDEEAAAAAMAEHLNSVIDVLEHWVSVDRAAG